jgi:thiamine-phosphate pyrophosphorylase
VTTEDRHCRLCLAISAAQSAEVLTAALAAADVAAVVLTVDGAADPSGQTLRPLIAAVQGAGAAALLSGDARLARTLHADGVHLPPSKTLLADYHSAREALGPTAIVGVDVGRSRHDAMTLGEAGADYVGFGVPDFVSEREQAIERQRELVAWWAEVFEVPVVAFDVTSPDWALAVAAAGADFVNLRLPVGQGLESACDLVAATAAALVSTGSAVGAAH